MSNGATTAASPYSKNLVAQFKAALPKIWAGSRVLITTSPTGVNQVSLITLCSGVREKAGTVVFVSVDRPSEFMSRLVKKHCSPDLGVTYTDKSQAQPADVRCVNGLFAPKLMLDAMAAVGGANGKVSLVISNIASLAFYNSNDRIREFMTALGKKLDEKIIERVILIMDGNEQYVFNMAKAFTENVVEITG